MEIYADIVFLINLAMDMVVFWIAGKLSRLKTTPIRLFLGSAAAAALYCALAFITILRPYYNFFTALAALMIGLLIAYNPKNIYKMAKLVVFSNIAAFAIGGAGFAIFYYSNIENIIGNALVFSYDNLSFMILITATAFSYISIKLVMTKLGNSNIRKQVYYNIVIYIGEKETKITALVDTGNFLADPLTKEPVIIAEYSAVKELLPNEAKGLYNEKKHDELLELLNAFSQTSFLKRVRILPYTSVGKQNGMLIGFKPDTVHIIKIDTGDIISKEAIIGIYNFELSADGSFRALLNPNIL